MTKSTFLDWLYHVSARFVEKPALALIPSQRILRWIFERTAQIGAVPPVGTRTVIDAQGGLTATPPDLEGDAPLLMYIHGGGFTIGSPRTHLAMAAHIAAGAGMRVYLPRYPLAPDYPFPAAVEMLITTYKQLCDAEMAPAALAGDSAGGNLALVTAMGARDQGLPLPQAMGLIAPLADMSANIGARLRAAPSEYLIPATWARRARQAYLNGHDPADPRVSPIFGDLTGLPPTLIQSAKDEGLSQDAARLAKALPQAQHIVWPGLHHVWQLKAGSSPAATRACAEMGTFLKIKAQP